MTKPLPTINDRYKITGLLGEGGFGAVYDAIHLAIDAPVAIKLLHNNDNPQAQHRFLQEARTAAQIDHPNIISIHDYGLTQDNRPYIVMERLQGHDLASELSQRGPLNIKRALNLLITAVDALGQAHRQGIVHKDLKPSNLFITHPHTRRESIKVVDFGIARHKDASITASDQTIGTARYMAPEYIEHQLVSPAIDVYQMGLIIVEALTGAPVVPADTWWGAVAAHVNHRLHVPATLTGSPLGPIIDKALQRHPEDRHPNAWALLDDLETLDLPSLAAAMALATDHTAPAKPHTPINLVWQPPAPQPPDGTALLRPCTFVMGSGREERGRVADEISHPVTLTRACVVQKVPVTQAQWQDLFGDNPSFHDGDTLPVENINWYEALAFCNALSRRHQLEECYILRGTSGKPGRGMTCQQVIFRGMDCDGWRLPTEAEWECAARAGTHTAFFSGPCTDPIDDEALASVAWFRSTSGGRTRPVGTVEPNGLDLYDMLGNISEWVWDLYAPYPLEPTRDPIVHTGTDTRRIHRGGAWHSLARDCRAARRHAAEPQTRNRTLGFRIARTWQNTANQTRNNRRRMP